MLDKLRCTECGATEFDELPDHRVRCRYCRTLYACRSDAPSPHAGVHIAKGAHVAFGPNVKITGGLDIEDGADVQFNGSLELLERGDPALIEQVKQTRHHAAQAHPAVAIAPVPSDAPPRSPSTAVDDPREATDELARAARKHRGEVAAARQKTAEHATAFAKPQWQRKCAALCGTAGERVGFYILLGVCGAVALGVVALNRFYPSLAPTLCSHLPQFHGDGGKGVGWALGVIASLGLFMLLVSMVADAIALFRQFALRRWPHMDCEHYLVQLGEPWGSAVVHVRMVFKEAWTESAQRDAIDAAKEWTSKPPHFSWDGRTLELTTERVDTEDLDVGIGSSSGGGFYHTNQPIHDATVALLHDVVRKLARHAPVERIQLEIEGEYYAEPPVASASSTSWRNKGWVKFAKGTLSFVASMGAIPCFILAMNYFYSPKTALEHFHFSRDAAAMAKHFNKPPSDHLHVHFGEQNGEQPVVEHVDFTHSRRRGMETWGFDVRLNRSSDDMRTRAEALRQGAASPGPQTFDSPSGSFNVDIDAEEVSGSGFTSPEIANAYWAAALYVIYDSSKPTTAQIAMFNEKLPADPAPYLTHRTRAPGRTLRQ